MLQVGAWVKLDQSWSWWCCFGFSPQLLTLLRLFLDVDMLLERSSLSVCSFRLIYWPVLWDQVQIVPILEIVVDTMALIDWGLFLQQALAKALFACNPRKGSPAHEDGTYKLDCQTRLILLWRGCWRRHGPYRLGPSSTTSLMKDFSSALTLGRVLTVATIA